MGDGTPGPGPEQTEKPIDQQSIELQATEVNPEWAQEMSESIDNALEEFGTMHEEYTNEKGDIFPASPIDLTPISITYGEDPRTFKELTQGEKETILNAAFSRVGYNPSAEPISSYEFDSPDVNEWTGKAKVTIHKTDRSDEGMFMHKIRFPDDSEEFFIARDTFKL